MDELSSLFFEDPEGDSIQVDVDSTTSSESGGTSEVGAVSADGEVCMHRMLLFHLLTTRLHV